MTTILAFSGSNSSISINQKLVECATQFLQHSEIKIIHLKDFPAPIYSHDIEENQGIPENIALLNSLIKEHDGLIISLPEYNSSITPVFKNTLDWISRLEVPILKNKPLLLMSTSEGKRAAISNFNHALSLMPRWGAEVISSYNLANFSEHINFLSTEITNSEEKTKLELAVRTFEERLIEIKKDKVL